MSKILQLLALLCCVGILMSSAGCTETSAEQEPLAPLVVALGNQRLLEPRLSGGFSYAHCQASSNLERIRCADRPKESPQRIVRAINEIRAQNRTPHVRLQAEAIVDLTTETDQGTARSIRKLEAAVRESGDARVWSDLAAAYVERAYREQAPYDLVRALEAAEYAITAEPRLKEALFNRALILERLHLKSQAVAAWITYLKVDGDSDWSREANRRSTALARPPETLFDDRGKAALEEATARGDRAAILRLVESSPQAVREHAMNELLPRWGELWSTGQRTAVATAFLNTAREIGKALQKIGGDRMVMDAVLAIDRSSTSTMDLLARAHATYGSASRLFRDLSIEAAGDRFAEAREDFSRAGSPMVFWADCGLIGVELSRHRYGPAFESFAALAKQIDRHLYPALYGRVSWGMGLVRGRQGKLIEALDHYRDAAAAFGEAREIFNEAALENMSAEALKLLGQSEPTWVYRYRALAVLTALPAGRQLHNQLWEAADDLLRSGRTGVARVFQDEGVEVARRSGEPFMIAEALHRRSRILAALGQHDRALRDIAEARTVNARGPSPVTRATTAADIDHVEGEIRLRLGRPQEALALLTRAVESFTGTGRPAEEILSRLIRARAYIELDLEAEAEADLSTALASFEEGREAIGDPVFRQSFSEAAQTLFDAMILLQAERRRDPGRALAAAERARTVPEAGALGSPEDLIFDARRLPDEVALVEYALSGDRLLVWTVHRGDIELANRRISPESFAARVAELIAAVRGGSEREITSASARIYDELIPPRVAALPSSVQLVFIPDRFLNGVPFAALRNPRTGRYLVEERASSVAPSAALYLASLSHGSTRERERWSALLISDPEFDRELFQGLASLPGAASEIAEVKDLYVDPLVLSGREATRSRLLAEMDRHEVFGFAGHAFFNSRAPENSYLVTAPEPSDRGTLLARDIASQRFDRLRLVVLTACHTSAATNRRIDGLSGLARPFLEAGAPAVLATLWDVDDQAASLVSAKFHRRFLESGDTALALRAAQLSVLHEAHSSTRSPSHWASFQMVGGLR